jgi:hypothetical protein
MSTLARLVARRSLALAQAMARPYAEGNMNSLVVITRHGGWDEEAGEYLPQSAKTTIYDDPDIEGIGAPAGVTPTTGPITFGFGDEPEYQDSVDVFIPKSAQLPRIGDKVKVTAGPDPQFIHREYKVISVIGSGRIVPSIHLRCSGAAPSRTTES